MESIHDQISSDIDNLYNDGLLNAKFEWVQGDFDNNGNEVASTTFVRTKYVPSEYITYATILNPPTTVYTFLWDENGNFVRRIDVAKNTTYVYKLANDYPNGKFAIAVGNTFKDKIIVNLRKNIATMTDIDDVNGRIDDVNGRIDDVKNMVNDLPSYYDDYVKILENKIDSVMSILENGDAFLYITDSHLQDNTCNSFPVMKELLKKTSIDKVLFNGDVPSAYGSKGYLELLARKNRDLFKTLLPYSRVLMGHGNHDFTVKTSSTSVDGYTFPLSFAYNYLTKIQEPYAHTEANKLYCYYDNEPQKVRYIIVDTSDSVNSDETTAWGVNYSIGQEQANWLCDTLNVPVDWTVVVMGHIPCDEQIVDYTTKMDILKNILRGYANKRLLNGTWNGVTINKDFSSYNGVLACYLCGHNHVDDDSKTDGVLSISTISDAYYRDGGYDRTRGTTNEIGLDAVVLDTKNRKIKLIRVGAGNDREFNY